MQRLVGAPPHDDGTVPRRREDDTRTGVTADDIARSKQTNVYGVIASNRPQMFTTAR